MMSKIKLLAIVALVIVLAIVSIGCEVNDNVETVQEAAETVAKIGTVHSMLKSLADAPLAQPSTR